MLFSKTACNTPMWLLCAALRKGCCDATQTMAAKPRATAAVFGTAGVDPQKRVGPQGSSAANHTLPHDASLSSFVRKVAPSPLALVHARTKKPKVLVRCRLANTDTQRLHCTKNLCRSCHSREWIAGTRMTCVCAEIVQERHPWPEFAAVLAGARLW